MKTEKTIQMGAENRIQNPCVVQADTYRNGPCLIPNWNQPLCIYYDETNNIRRLKLSEVGLNAPADKTFAIGGIALMPGQVLSGWEDLRRIMSIQPSATEVKFKHVAQPGYEESLKSSKLYTLLNWLVDTDVLIHYSVLDVLYWSILDIIESLMPDGRIEINEIHIELKNELYFAVTLKPSQFMALLHSFGYPNIQRPDVGPFLEAVLRFVVQCVPVDRNVVTAILKQTLRRAANLPDLELIFLHDNQSGELIDDFSVHFMHCICIFKHGTHVLDRETYIEKTMKKVELRDGDRLLDYRFSDSKNEIGIQVSDVVTGLLGRHFSYLQQHSLPQLRQRMACFSNQQLQNLELIRKLIERSNSFSAALLHAVLPLDTNFKNDEFLHHQRAPVYLSN